MDDTNKEKNNISTLPKANIMFTCTSSSNSSCVGKNTYNGMGSSRAITQYNRMLPFKPPKYVEDKK